MKKVAKWAHSTIIVPEQIERQAVRKRYPPPLYVCPRKPLATELRQYCSNCVRRETMAKQKRHERQPLVYAQCHTPRTFQNNLAITALNTSISVGQAGSLLHHGSGR
jgi:hypothetical protein